MFETGPIPKRDRKFLMSFTESEYDVLERLASNHAEGNKRELVRKALDEFMRVHGVDQEPTKRKRPKRKRTTKSRPKK